MERKTISQTVNIDVEYIAQTLSFDLSHDEIIDFIKKLDLSVADWEFTLRLAAYFKEQENIFDKEREL